MKKILIITYYWPPKGGVGVQRWLKLSKYLNKKKYQPIIYTSSGGVTPLEDSTLINEVPSDIEVLKKNIFEPQKLFSFFTQQRPNSDILIQKESGFFQNMLIWLRANLFIPDTRSLWINPSVQFLNQYLRNNPVDVVISTGPPHSMHLIALALKQQNNLKWIADFRDPWTEIEYFENLPLLSSSRSKHKKLEKKVLNTADLVLSVSESWSNNLIALGAQKTSVLTNGYDPDDYNDNFPNKMESEFKIGYFGLYNAGRDHSFFWETLSTLSKNEVDFSQNLQLLFAGEVHSDFINVLKSFKFYEKLEYHDYLSHRDSIRNMMQCNLLLVTQADEKSINGRIPAKLFEYLATKQPILVIGKKNSDLEKIVSNISYVWFVDFNNQDLLYETILKIYNLSRLETSFNDDISYFSRDFQAQELINLIESL